MPAGVEIFNSVLNQLGSPAIYSDVFSNRPAFGFTGRLFISTDTNEIYRDTGTAWVLISSGGGGVNIYNSNGTLTAARTVTMAGFPLTFSGGASAVNLNLNANAGVDRDINFQTAGANRWELLVTGVETGSNAGADFALRSYNDAGTFIFSPFTVRRRTGEIETFAEENITTAAQSIIGLYTNSTGTYAGGLTTTGGNPQSSNFNIYTLATAGSVTFANSNLVGTTVNVLRAQVQNAGTITFPPGASGGLRAATNFVSQLQYNTAAAAATYTRMANVHLQGVYEVSGGNTFTITNAHQLLINALNENAYTGAQLTITNRWGIYQDGASDGNYFAGVMQLGSTTSTGEQLQVTGTARVTQSAFLATASGDVGIGTTTPTLENNTAVKELTVTKSGGATNIASFNLQGDRSNDGAVQTRVGTINFWQTTNNIARINGLRFNANNSGGLAFETDNAGAGLAERLRITSGGNVLIGTTTDTGELLQVNGTIRGTGAAYFATTSGSVGIALTNATISGFRFDVNGTTLLRSNTAIGPSTATFGTSATNTLAISTGTAPASSPADCFQLYSADITAGNAAAHFRTEGGAVIKVYQETTAVGSAVLATPGAGTNIKDVDTFDGYTIAQVVKALRNQGLLA
jgi:hypothetical protein